ncbi:hypothetical protein [Achromobacter xylosoxidans]|uniref:hypothetical protein n=1 Tax=Alcaligenes xylosoxydans xylosoxydans TaxID=85698 RepID=UPI00131E3C50|nr:hypothetical protein [Achromobacter xylosoxidans]
MKLNLVSVAFSDSTDSAAPAWAELRYQIYVPSGVEVGGHISTTVEMPRDMFEAKSVKELSDMGVAKIRQHLEIGK